MAVNGRLALPPKRILSTTFIPSAWIDDALIAERKIGLQTYLSGVLRASEYKGSKALADFLEGLTHADKEFEVEDALPSTLSRQAALDMAKQVSIDDAEGDIEPQATTIAAAYYPGEISEWLDVLLLLLTPFFSDWSAGTWAPESIDFGKFDILFYGETPGRFIPLALDD